MLLLGLAVAVLLAMTLQLNALRARRAGAYDLADGGVIHLRAWIVLDTEPSFRDEALAAFEAVRTTVLMLPGRVTRAVRQLRPRRVWRPAPAPISGRMEPWTPQTDPAAATGPPAWPSNFGGNRWRSPPGPGRARIQRPPCPGGRFAFQTA